MILTELPPPPQHLTERVVRVASFAPGNSSSLPWANSPPRVYSLVVESAAAPWLRDAVTRVSELTALRSNWDTYGSQPIDASSATSAVSFLLDHAYRSLSAPSVVPMSDGGVQLEWHRGDVDLEIAFSRVEPGVCAEDLRTGEIVEEPLASAAQLIARYLSRLSE